MSVAETVGANARARNVLRTMPRRELMDILAGQNVDPLFVEAALEADPRMVANIGPALRKLLETRVVQSKFGPLPPSVSAERMAWTAIAVMTPVTKSPKYPIPIASARVNVCLGMKSP